MGRLLSLGAVCAALWALPGVALAVPGLLNQQGRLLDSQGVAISGPTSVRFTLYPAATGGAALWTETQTLTLDGGYYSTDLGKVVALDTELFDGSTLYLEIAVNSVALTSRIPLRSVPYAIRAQDADTATNVSGGIVDATEIRIGGRTVIDSGGVVDATAIQVDGLTVIDGSGTPAVSWTDLDDIPAGFADGTDDGMPTCTDGQIAVRQSGAWSCSGVSAHTHDATQITTGTLSVDRLPVGTGAGKVAAGTHAHSGADITSGQISVDRLPVGTSALQVAAGDHGHDAADLETGTVSIDRLPVGTGSAQVARGSDSLAAVVCDEGETLRYDAAIAQWECGSSATGASSPLLASFEFDELSGTSFVDGSGGGHTATTSGGGVASGSTGHAGKGIAFSGGVVRVPAGNAIGSSPYVTVDAWIQPSLPLTGTKVIATKEGAWTLSQTAAQVAFTVQAATGSCTVTSPYSVAAGAWSIVSGTYNGRSVAVGLDDRWVEVACTKGPLVATPGTPLDIGADATSGSAVSPFSGTIDEVRLWSIAPTPSGMYSTAGAFPGSVLISPEEGLQINKWIGDERQVWTRCYRLTVDGSATTTFHARCDGRGASVTVATLSTGRKVGGYTPRSWDSSSGYAYAGGTFLFSLTSGRRFDAPGDQTWTSSIYNSSSYGPTFGNGHDFSPGYSGVIGNGGGDDYCNLGYSFACHEGSYGSTACRNDFCGTYEGWTISELEVWVYQGR